MQTTEYLYGVKPEVFENMRYVNALELKHTLAKKVLAEVNDEYFESLDNWDDTADLRKRISDVSKAVEHNYNLLEELREDCA